MPRLLRLLLISAVAIGAAFLASAVSEEILLGRTGPFLAGLLLCAVAAAIYLPIRMIVRAKHLRGWLLVFVCWQIAVALGLLVIILDRGALQPIPAAPWPQLVAIAIELILLFGRTRAAPLYVMSYLAVTAVPQWVSASHAQFVAPFSVWGDILPGIGWGVYWWRSQRVTRTFGVNGRSSWPFRQLPILAVTSRSDLPAFVSIVTLGGAIVVLESTPRGFLVAAIAILPYVVTLWRLIVSDSKRGGDPVGAGLSVGTACLALALLSLWLLRVMFEAGPKAGEAFVYMLGVLIFPAADVFVIPFLISQVLLIRAARSVERHGTDTRRRYWFGAAAPFAYAAVVGSAILFQRAATAREQWERERPARAARDAHAQYVGSLPRAVKVWDVEVHGGPALVRGPDGTVYVAGLSGLSAIDLYRGQRWTNPAIHTATPPALGPDGTLYVGDVDGQLLAIDPGGQVRWSRAICLGTSTGAPAVSARGDRIYVGCQPAYDGKPIANRSEFTQPAMTAFAPDGTKQWSLPLGYVDGRPPGIIDSYVYVVARMRAEDGIGINSALFAIGDNGAVNWKIRVPTDTLSIVIDSTVFVDNLSALSALTPAGVTLWTIPPPVSEGRQLGVTGDGSLWRTERGSRFGNLTIAALGLDGAKRWTYDPSRITGLGVNRATAGDHVTFVESRETLVALDSEGSVEWIYDQAPDRALRSRPVTVNDVVCVLTGYISGPRTWLSVLRPPERLVKHR